LSAAHPCRRSAPAPAPVPPLCPHTRTRTRTLRPRLRPRPLRPRGTLRLRPGPCPCPMRHLNRRSCWRGAPAMRITLNRIVLTPNPNPSPDSLTPLRRRYRHVRVHLRDRATYSRGSWYPIYWTGPLPEQRAGAANWQRGSQVLRHSNATCRGLLLHACSQRLTRTRWSFSFQFSLVKKLTCHE
jgi:hypothetical protein